MTDQEHWERPSVAMTDQGRWKQASALVQKIWLEQDQARDREREVQAEINRLMSERSDLEAHLRHLRHRGKEQMMVAWEALVRVEIQNLAPDSDQEFLFQEASALLHRGGVHLVARARRLVKLGLRLGSGTWPAEELDEFIDLSDGVLGLSPLLDYYTRELDQKRKKEEGGQ